MQQPPPEPATPIPLQPAALIVHDNLRSHPGSTVVQISKATALARSTVAQALADLEKSGLARRDDSPGHHGARQNPHLWHLLPDVIQLAEPVEPARVAPQPDASPEPAEASGGDSAPPTPPAATDHPDTDASGETNAASTPTRLLPGELRALVAAHLAAHPEQHFTVGQIARAIGAKSSGAVANCLDHLTIDGTAVQTSEKPRRYTAPQ
ncbi:MarR family transcriptional regulator [Yinghuangia seranimata]|uniref:MarR family transcriptional regulator n=1 Tax=Yinghuangia seranimata TaxID=408067 RepID=UPI00248ACCEB|nr:helix-turn-helix domain-containing protein [Yinghuangia seranimata]MDI2132560.1 helix-turn-helix domain-containing protein [Yinghuangia seranimata]